MARATELSLSLEKRPRAAGARSHRPRAKPARTPGARPAFSRRFGLDWRPRSSRRRTGDQCRGPALAGRGRARTSGALSTPPLAANRASPAGRGWRRRRRRPSVTRRPRAARIAAARRAPALKTRRLRAGEIEAAGGAIVLGPQRRLIERAAVEQAAPVTRAGDRRRQAPFPPEIGLLVFGQTVRTELQPRGLPTPPPARRKIGAHRQQERARANPGERHAVDGSGSEARAADQPIAHDRRQREIESAGPGAGTQIESRSERPLAADRCRRPADAASSR